MGKPKKGKKSTQDDDFGDEVEVDILANEEGNEEAVAKPSKKKGKKGRRKNDLDEEDDIAAEIAALSLEAGIKPDDDEDVPNGNVPAPKSKKEKKKEKKKNKKIEEEEDEDDSDSDITALATKTANKKSGKQPAFSAFAMLDVEEDEDVEADDSPDEEIIQPQKPQTKNKAQREQSVEAEDDDDEEEVVDTQEKAPEPSTKSNKKGKKEKKKKQKAEEEDIDALLAELEKPTEKKGKKGKKGKKKQDEEEEDDEAKAAEEQMEVVKEVETAPKTIEELELELEEEENARKKGKKGKKSEDQKEGSVEGGEEGEKAEGEEDDSEFRVKTAAEKKKEKKERQKREQKEKKLKEKQKKKKGDAKDEEAEKAETVQAAEESSVKAEEAPTDAASAAGEEKPAEEEEEVEGKKSKKKKKKDKEKDAKEEKGKKRPAKAMVKAMQEALQAKKEEDERLKQEQLEKERREEEARLQQEEKERLEKEKRERKKLKEKEKKERLKAEGKYLTAKQKENKRRAMQMLEAMKARGMEIPQRESGEGGEGRTRPLYESKKKKRPQNTQEAEDEPETPTPSEEVKPIVEAETPTEEKEKALDEKEEVKDDWEMESDEEKEEKEKEAEVKTESPAATSKPSSEEREETPESKEDEDEEIEEEDEESDDDEEESEEEESDSEEEESSDEDDDMTAAERAKQKALDRIQKRQELSEKNKTADRLRAPVVCVLGHVDTGKTKILDKLRRTNVQDGEAGGITQQIGATNVPDYAIKNATTMCKDFSKKELRVPGLLIIDTPGHESFSNLRSRGSSLCDIAILVVDIMHGLEPQTIESINLLKSRKTPFIVALNKIDRLYNWKTTPNSDVQNTLKKQARNTKDEFDERAKETIIQFAEQGLNAALFYENKNPREFVSLVPTSAHSGDGMGNLLALICELSQTLLTKRLSYGAELQATVMEVKALPGLGTTLDVIVINGKIKEGATIIVAGTEGPIVTQVRGLLMPQPMKELRVKNAYEKHKEVVGAQGVKIIAKDLEKSLAGLPLYVAEQQDEVEVWREDIEASLAHVLNSIKLQDRGVFVQASTLGSLEALLEFLRTSKIPYAGLNIGPVHKKDVMRTSAMLEHNPEYAMILAFDVKIEREAQDLADSLGVKIFSAEIIYHLFDQFTKYQEDYKAKLKAQYKHLAVFPCKVRVLPQFIFNSRDPIVVGVSIEAGFIKEGMPLCVPSKEFTDLGIVTSIEINNKPVEVAKKGQEVCIKIDPKPGEAPKMYGRHFEHEDMLMSKISRESIDALKKYFRDEMTKTDWQLIMEMKKIFDIL